MLIVGLCGGSGSGKSTVAALFSSHGIPSLNADTIYHELVSHRSACLAELCSVFGEGIVRDGALDRQALARIVFGAGENATVARATLNRIAHAHVLKEAMCRIRQLAEEGAAAVIFDAPLLFESGFDASCDIIVCVVADEQVRIERLLRRDGISEEQARARIRAQISDEELCARSDRVLHGDTDLAELARQVEALAKEILDTARKNKEK